MKIMQRCSTCGKAHVSIVSPCSDEYSRRMAESVVMADAARCCGAAPAEMPEPMTEADRIQRRIVEMRLWDSFTDADRTEWDALLDRLFELCGTVYACERNPHWRWLREQLGKEAGMVPARLRTPIHMMFAANHREEK